MLQAHVDTLLSDLLVNTHRSLVQFVHEAWPWKRAEDEPIQRVIDSVARAQQEHARGLFQLLLRRGNRPDLGIYPADFTSLHFVSLDYLYPLIVQGQKQLVDQLTAAVGKVASDPAAQRLLETILAAEHQGLRQLESVKLPHPVG